jgi:hypothetical protein
MKKQLMCLLVTLACEVILGPDETTLVPNSLLSAVSANARSVSLAPNDDPVAKLTTLNGRVESASPDVEDWQSLSSSAAPQPIAVSRDAHM